MQSKINNYYWKTEFTHNQSLWKKLITIPERHTLEICWHHCGAHCTPVIDNDWKSSEPELWLEVKNRWQETAWQKLQNDFIADKSCRAIFKSSSNTVSLDTQYCKKKMSAFIINFLMGITGYSTQNWVWNLSIKELDIYSSLQVLTKN